MFLAIAAALAVSAPMPAPTIDPQASQPLAPVSADHAPGSCRVRLAANGMRLPDPACTPGAVNPTITGDILRNPSFRTGQERDLATTAAQKRKVYAWYGITPPAINHGPGQVCELDHLISIRIGGGDTLDNIWPQCGPANVRVGLREFKIKDAAAESGAARLVKEGADLADVQHRIAQDWTQFIIAEPIKTAAK